MEFQGEVKLVSISGNISSGKSTLIQNIRERIVNNPNVIIVDEPVDVWENIRDSSNRTILEAFYSDPQKLAFTFQICALFTRNESLKMIMEREKERSRQIGSTIIVIIERTILDDYNIFAKMLYNDKKISEIEMKVYNMWYESFSRTFKLNASVYVESDPNLCLERIKQRNRNGESNISLEYLVACDNQHRDFYQNVLIDHNCLLINGNVDMQSTDYDKNLEKILSHFSE